ncbi:uncharacterized protein V6R79_019461 [Siganus canaliculatus]
MSTLSLLHGLELKTSSCQTMIPAIIQVDRETMTDLQEDMRIARMSYEVDLQDSEPLRSFRGDVSTADAYEPGMLCVSGYRISECSLAAAAASEQGQRSRCILSQYGNRSSSSASTKAGHTELFVTTAKDPSEVKTYCLRTN